MTSFVRRGIPLAALLLVAAGCGGQATGIGPDDGQLEAPSAGPHPALDDDTASSSSPSSVTPLFACEFDGGEWAAPHDGRVVISRAGSSLFVDKRRVPLSRVDKSGPHSSYVSYTLFAGGETYVLHGRLGAGDPSRPGEVVHNVAPAPAAWWVCKDRIIGPITGTFNDAALDALVTLTNGRRG